ncbi:MAG: hypothetical protein ACI4WH_04665 [Oscillospiraceae bacterium]
MAKSKSKHPKKKNYRQKNIKQTVNQKNLQRPTENKNVYTQEYLDYKHQQEDTKPLILRIFVIILVCVILVGFVIAPLF